MDNPAILLIIVFIIAPLIERLLRAGKGAQQPPEQRMPPRRQQPSERQRQQPEPPVVVQRTEDDEAAAAMLPDDLWEILTGEKRAPRLPQPQPQTGSERIDQTDEAYSLETEPSSEWIADDDTDIFVREEEYIRPVPDRAPPPIVSLEELEIDSGLRHEQFHDRIDGFPAAARARPSGPQVFRFTSNEDLRRGIIIREVLGPPKGLE